MSTTTQATVLVVTDAQDDQIKKARYDQTFLVNLEPSTRVCDMGDVGPALELAAALVQAEAP
jgi:hypothetical protein